MKYSEYFTTCESQSFSNYDLREWASPIQYFHLRLANLPKNTFWEPQPFLTDFSLLFVVVLKETRLWNRPDPMQGLTWWDMEANMDQQKSEKSGE